VEEDREKAYRIIWGDRPMRRAVLIVLAALAAIAGEILIQAEPRVIWLTFWATTIVGACLFILVSWHARATAYQCPKCTGEFQIPRLTDFVSRHVLGRKYLRCPACGERVWAREFGKPREQKEG
jgi:DNA-directed RNA polymerase subunit RPC12/RpoP